MKKAPTMRNKYLVAGLALCCMASCKPNLKTGGVQKGSADFTTYVAVGSSHTAGYADNSLYKSAQQNSYPAILAQQFKLAGGGNFTQPYVNGESGWPYDTTLNLERLILGYHTGCDGVTSLLPGNYPNADTANNNGSISIAGPYNNQGVPGVRCVDYLWHTWVAVAVTQHAPYAYRFYKNPAGSPQDELNYTVNKLNPTMFTVWLGNDDAILGYAAKAGGQASANTLPIFDGRDTFIAPNDISPVSLFAREYDSVVIALTKNGAKGALLNIPDIASFPFFTTVPVNALTLTDIEAAALNLEYGGANSIHFVAGNNYFVIEDHNGNKRQIKDGEFIILTVPQDSLKCAGWGSTKAIPKQYVLTADEVGNVRTAVSLFNSVIQQEATTHNLAYVDMNSFMKTLQTGIVYSGVNYSATFVSGGAFSLDGIHFSPRGNAIVANQIIMALNSKYGSSVPMANENSYPGIKFP
jgi:hypothetical protein